MLKKLLCAALIVALAPCATADIFSVSTPAEFQAALTTAQENGQNDTINVQPGTYDISAAGTLTYIAVSTENTSLTINGVDSTFVTLDGGSQVPILRIDTTAVVDDEAVAIVINAMTFRNGNATGTFTDGGALAILTDKTPLPWADRVVIDAAEFFDNSAEGNGGAIYVEGQPISGILLNDLTVDGNSAGAYGGGAYLRGNLFNTPIAAVNVDFWNNTAAAGGGGLAALGFDVDTPSEDRTNVVNLVDVIFYNNSVTGVGGTGGGADISALTVFIDIAGFADNQADIGGGLNIRDNFGDLKMFNSGFAGNSAAEGGGMMAGPALPFSVDITNNTVYQNTADDSGGGIFLAIDGSSLVVNIYNNILHSNSAIAGSGDDLYVNNRAFEDIGATVDIFNNIVTDFLVVPGPANSGANITDQAPVFVDMERRPIPDPRLATGSPGIDQGNNAAPNLPSNDFEFDDRPLDGDGDTIAVVDIGMDEVSGAPAQNIDLSILKVDDPDPVTEGGNITYSVSISNAGPGDASGVSMSDTLAGAVTFVSATPSVGSCSESSGTVTCGIGALASGASASVVIVVSTPDIAEPLTVTNTASVTAIEADSNAANNSVTIDTTVVPLGPAQADLALTKADNPDPVFSGGPTLTFTLDVTNNGPDGATGVTVTDTLPEGVTFDSATFGTASCTETNGTVSCSIGAMAANSSTTITIVVVPDVVTGPTVITNTATVTGVEEDPVPANDTATTTSTVNAPSADLSAAVFSSPAEPMANEPVTYDVLIDNAGPSTSSGVVATVALPSLAEFVSASIDQGSCAADASTLVCTIGDMAAGAFVGAEIVVNAPDAATVLTLSATISADVADPSDANNVVSANVTVINMVDLVIEGNSKGGGSLGWLEIVLLLAVLAVVASRRLRRDAAGVTLVILAGVALCLSPLQAEAAGDWYVGGAVGQSSIDYSASDLSSDLARLGWTIESPSVDESGTAWKIYAGFMFNDWLGLEAGYADLGEVTTRFGASIAPTEIDTLLADTLSVHPYQGDGWIAAALVRWPFAEDRFAITARAGLFAWESKTNVRVVSGGTGQVASDDSGTDSMFGVGIEWQINETWYLSAGWERYKLNEWLDVPMIGVGTRF
jgi:uncharacterized repeat protein (TIGR01451 family)